MLLSIGMIVKNEEKYLDKCLSALRPVLEQVDSELIIADTGSTDNSFEIAQKYTEKVFSFKWTDDFSAARNSTVERASGDWFMFLDADEIFESCNDIISFFTSGESKKYNSATFVIRNKYADGGSSDFNAPRLTRLKPNTRFDGVIHETLLTFGGEIKDLKDIAIHYGYLINDEAEKENKFNRNSVLLQKKLEKCGESDPLIFLQLYECYCLHDRKKAEEYLEHGIRVCEQGENPVLIALYCHKAHLRYFDGKYKDCLSVCDKYFRMSRRIRPGIITTDCEMHGFRASSLYHTGQSDTAISAYSSFFTLRSMIKNGKLKTADADMLVYFISADENLCAALFEFLSACVSVSDTTSAINVMCDTVISDIGNNPTYISALVNTMQTLIGACGNEYEAGILTSSCNKLCAKLSE